jgi:outer membrane protein OmpA-like peptidoglycan-associated protein
MEAVYRVRQSQDLAPLGASAQAQELVVEVRETSVQAANAEVAKSESAGAGSDSESDSNGADSGPDSGPDSDTKSGTATDAEALADAQQRIAELEREGERLREDLAEHQSALESGELAMMEAQRQLEAAQANAGAARCGALLADLGAMDLNTGLTDSGLRIALSSGDLQFASGSADLTEDTDRERLQALAAWLDDYPDLQVRVIGYTDASGGEDANQALSAERAEAVREALIASGVSPEQLNAEGRGEQEPIAENATPEGREQNRRVELLLEATKHDS